MSRLLQKTPLAGIPRQTLFLGGMTLILVTVAVSGLVLPGFARLTDLRSEIAARTVTLMEQQQLYPVFARALAFENIPFDPQLPLVEKTPLPRTQIATLTQELSDILSRQGMTDTRCLLDIATLTDTATRMAVTLQFSGTLPGFRESLVRICALPYLNSIRYFSIQSTENNTGKHFFLKLAVDIQPGTA